MDLDAELSPALRLWGAQAGAWRFRVAAYAGREEKARQLFEAVDPWLFRRGQRPLPGDAFGLHAAIEGLATLGDVERAGARYDDAVASLDLGIQGNWDLLWQTTTGLAAACAGRWHDAEAHFATAIEQAATLPHHMARADTLRWWGWTLLRRDEPGDHERAREFLTEAVERYDALGALLFADIARSLSSRVPE